MRVNVMHANLRGSLVRNVMLGLMVAILSFTSAHAAETLTFTYDAKGRLVKVERTGTVNNGVATIYTHDKADNRTNVKTTGAP